MQKSYSYQPGREEPPRRRQQNAVAPRHRHLTVTSKKKTPTHVRRSILLGVCIFAVSALVTFGIGSAFTKKDDTLGDKTTVATQPAPKPKPVPSVILTPNAEINAIIAAHPGVQIGVGIQDITTGEHVAYGTETPFVAASTGKLIAAAAYYHKVEIGERSLDTVLGNYAASYQIQQMINQSNNNSWYLIQTNLGLSNLTTYAASIDIFYMGTNNTTTPESMASFLADLYKGEVLNKEHTAQLLSYMQNTNWETFMVPAIPEGIRFYHKYGLLNDVAHDVAILVKGEKAYALTIYTSGADYTSNNERVQALQAITTAATAQMFNK